MKLINGVYYYSPWESAVMHFKALKNKQGIPASHRLAELLASEIHVTLAVLEDETLEWDYKLVRLINVKDFKRASDLLDMLIAHLKRNTSTPSMLRAAHHLRGAWSEMKYAQSAVLHKPKQLKVNKLQSTRDRILDSVSSLLGDLRAMDVV